MTRLLAAAVLTASLSAAGAAAASPDAVGGTWEIKGKVSAFAFTLTCRFEQHAEGLGGICYDGGTNKAHPLTSGQVTDGKVRWTYQSDFMMRKFEASYSAVIEGGQMKGQVSAPGYSGLFTGRRP